jgi:hypothetical protein
MMYISLIPIIIALYSRFLITRKNKSGFVLEFISCLIFMIYYGILKEWFLILFMFCYAIIAVIGYFSWKKRELKPVGICLSDYYVNHDPIPEKSRV